MGDGKKLKEHIDNKGTNVRKIAKEKSINTATITGRTTVNVFSRFFLSVLSYFFLTTAISIKDIKRSTGTAHMPRYRRITKKSNM